MNFTFMFPLYFADYVAFKIMSKGFNLLVAMNHNQIKHLIRMFYIMRNCFWEMNL